MKRVLVLALLVLSGCNQTQQIKESQEDRRVTPEAKRDYAQITLAQKDLKVEVVASPERITLGLSYRPEIGVSASGAGQVDGMLFVLPERHIYSFWMKGMMFDLDMIWIDCGAEGLGSLDLSACLIVDVTENAKAPVSPANRLPTYSPAQPATHVLEVVAGDYQRLFGD